MLKNKFDSGFSITEILVVLGLMAAILLVMIPQFMRMLNEYRAQSAIAQMRTQFRFARNACVAQKITYRIVIDASTDTYSVEKWNESTASFKTVKGADFTLPPFVDIEGSSTAGPFVFNSRGGISPSGNIDLSVAVAGQALTDSYRLTIHSTGTVEQSKL